VGHRGGGGGELGGPRGPGVDSVRPTPGGDRGVDPDCLGFREHARPPCPKTADFTPESKNAKSLIQRAATMGKSYSASHILPLDGGGSSPDTSRRKKGIAVVFIALWLVYLMSWSCARTPPEPVSIDKRVERILEHTPLIGNSLTCLSVATERS
jgi:hypothetical protein